MSKANKALARRSFEEIVSLGKLEVADEVYAPHFVYHSPGDVQVPPGPEGIKQLVAPFRIAFPDVRATVEDQIAEGDRVVTRWVARGTHKGEFMGLPPTGRTVTLKGITINRIVGGRIVEEWESMDWLPLMQQLGAFPAFGKASR